ncbi:unnamed protein product [Prorocentrum cordatum]|uniref:Mei2-like C-terminal RNA recognition motif domain-containing protein n=1 Tax=Prorocentrum cordatum TaxID=2364126 RepID=A0ABN9R3Q3_9DINO|nr:unnamed protein product [Polarella glacialis]
MSTGQPALALGPTAKGAPLEAHLDARGRWARGPIGHPPGLLELGAKLRAADDDGRAAVSDTCSGSSADHSDADEDASSEPWSAGPVRPPPGLLLTRVPLASDGGREADSDERSVRGASPGRSDADGGPAAEPWPVAPAGAGLGLEVGKAALARPHWLGLEVGTRLGAALAGLPAGLPLPLKVPVRPRSGGGGLAGSDGCSRGPAPEPWPLGPLRPPPGLGLKGAGKAAPAGAPPEPSPLRSQAEPYVPKCLALAGSQQTGLDVAGPKPHERTTVMMRNIPLSCTCDSLIELLESKGFSGWFDFVYVPIKRTEVLGVGYGFVNLVTPERAEEFMLAFEGFDGWAESPSRAASTMHWSVCQGLSRNISRYRNSPLMTDEVPAFYKPVLLKDGVRIAFPRPTTPLRAPRRRAIKE